MGHTTGIKTNIPKETNQDQKSPYLCYMTHENSKESQEENVFNNV